jgi:hypothetical protein
MTPNTAPPEGSSGSQGDEQRQADPSDPQATNGPQTGVQRLPALESCRVCGTTERLYWRGAGSGLPYCTDCEACGWGQNPCVRTGINDPAVSAPAALDRAHRAEAAVREWLPALRRAVDCLDTTCRYHGDQLDPDRFGRMTRSEACCDTGIEPRRAREARTALAALTRLTEEQQ